MKIEYDDGSTDVYTVSSGNGEIITTDKEEPLQDGQDWKERLMNSGIWYMNLSDTKKDMVMNISLQKMIFKQVSVNSNSIQGWYRLQYKLSSVTGTVTFR